MESAENECNNQDIVLTAGHITSIRVHTLVRVDVHVPPLSVASADCKSSVEVALLAIGASADCRNCLVISIHFEGCHY